MSNLFSYLVFAILILGLGSCSKTENLEEFQVKNTPQFRTAATCPLPTVLISYPALTSTGADPFEDFDGALDEYYQCEFPPIIYFACHVDDTVHKVEVENCCRDLTDLVSDIGAITNAEIIFMANKARTYALNHAPACPEDGSDMTLTNLDFFFVPPSVPLPSDLEIGFYAEYKCCVDGGIGGGD